MSLNFNVHFDPPAPARKNILDSPSASSLISKTLCINRKRNTVARTESIVGSDTNNNHIAKRSFSWNSKCRGDVTTNAQERRKPYTYTFMTIHLFANGPQKVFQSSYGGGGEVVINQTQCQYGRYKEKRAANTYTYRIICIYNIYIYL